MHFVVAKPPTSKQFLLNREEKMKDKDFEADIFAILHPGIAYDHVKAFEFVNYQQLSIKIYQNNVSKNHTCLRHLHKT